ncbi:alpha/beta hydrolase [Caulobacter soli]|uniref:alpha/beta hydrolase n=1 Tax=Caulobacter soli TaxID=2708539 RepID=UPI00196AE209|nr:alpha/beta hydrolase [Caulobacter soli]
MLVHAVALMALLISAPSAPSPDAPSAIAGGPATVSLWPRGAPGAEGRAGEPEIVENTYVRNVHSPSLTVFPADPRHANGAAIIIAPGGGHRMLVFVNEGSGPAKALNRYGVTVFVLKYRLAREAGSTYAIDRDAAADLRRAVRWVRANAAQYGVDPHRIGVMGFSAGGELVSLVADNPEPPHSQAPGPTSADPLDAVSARPDFQVLVYPGPLGVPAQAPAGAPPAFIAAGSLDACCAEPAVTLYEQLRKAGVSAELHMFADMDHGFNIAAHSESLSILHWPDRLADWLGDGGWLRPRPLVAPKPFKP